MAKAGAHLQLWILLVAGGVAVLVSFMEDFRNTTAGGLPHRFAWSVFVIGELVGAGAFLHALVGRTLRSAAGPLAGHVVG